MSQYRAYFVPGAVDPRGLQQIVITDPNITQAVGYSVEPSFRKEDGSYWFKWTLETKETPTIFMENYHRMKFFDKNGTFFAERIKKTWDLEDLKKGFRYVDIQEGNGPLNHVKHVEKESGKVVCKITTTMISDVYYVNVKDLKFFKIEGKLEKEVFPEPENIGSGLIARRERTEYSGNLDPLVPFVENGLRGERYSKIEATKSTRVLTFSQHLTALKKNGLWTFTQKDLFWTTGPDTLETESMGRGIFAKP